MLKKKIIEAFRTGQQLFFSFLKLPLLLASLVFNLIVLFRFWLYQKGWLKAHTVKEAFTLSVGNLTVGGSGKTPVVAALIEAFQHDFSLAVISRGWKSLHAAIDGNPLCINDSLGPLFTAIYAGDEPVMLAYRYPTCSHWIGVNKLATAIKAAQRGPRLLIVDDGFQHLPLKREANLLVVDSKQPPWKDHLLPYGRLRESVSAIQRADFILFTNLEHADLYPRLKEELSCYTQAPTAAMASSSVQICSWHGKIGDDLFGRKAALFCGVARPDRFKEMVKKLGAEPLVWRYLSDHSFYTKQQLELYAQEALNQGAECLVCTEKDAVKYLHDPPHLSLPLYWPRLECKIIAGAEAWKQLVDRVALTASRS